MNDDFFTRYRKSPPREFSEALYKRINVPMNIKRTPSLRRLTFAAALCMALIAALAFSPAARAAFNGLIVEIGGMIFFESERSASQATPLPESQVTLVPEETLPLAEAQAKLPYYDSSCPPGCRMDLRWAVWSGLPIFQALCSTGDHHLVWLGP